MTTDEALSTGVGPTTMENQTYLLQTAPGQYSPPLTVETLVGYARSGAIRPETFLYDQRAAAWIPAHQVPELKVAFSGAAQASIPTFQTATAVAQPRTPMSRGAKSAIISAIVITVALCGGGVFGFVGLVQKGIQEASRPETFASTSGLVEVTAPGTWSARPELHDDAVIEISDALQNVYVIVIEEPVTDFDNIDLESYSRITREAMLENLKNSELGARSELVINGKKAIQHEIEGTADFIRVKYLHTVVATPTHLYQVMGWGTPSDFDRQREGLEKVLYSFKERSSGGGAQAPN